ncbi:MAG: hypothetical protein AAB317_04420 [Nitrospirota bacterium]
MKCHRCGGIMISDFFQDLEDDTGHLCFHGMRCIPCGEVLDPVILANRQKRPHHQARNRKLMTSGR